MTVPQTDACYILLQPEKVFAEIYRVLKPGGACIVTFSNRQFYDKVATGMPAECPRRTFLISVLTCICDATCGRPYRRGGTARALGACSWSSSISPA